MIIKGDKVAHTTPCIPEPTHLQVGVSHSHLIQKVVLISLWYVCLEYGLCIGNMDALGISHYHILWNSLIKMHALKKCSDEH